MDVTVDKKETYDELLKTKRKYLTPLQETDRIEATVHPLNGNIKVMQIDSKMLDQTHRHDNEQRMRKFKGYIVKQKHEFDLCLLLCENDDVVCVFIGLLKEPDYTLVKKKRKQYFIAPYVYSYDK